MAEENCEDSSSDITDTNSEQESTGEMAELDDENVDTSTIAEQIVDSHSFTSPVTGQIVDDQFSSSIAEQIVDSHTFDTFTSPIAEQIVDDQFSSSIAEQIVDSHTFGTFTSPITEQIVDDQFSSSIAEQIVDSHTFGTFTSPIAEQIVDSHTFGTFISPIAEQIVDDQFSSSIAEQIVDSHTFGTFTSPIAEQIVDDPFLSSVPERFSKQSMNTIGEVDTGIVDNINSSPSPSTSTRSTEAGVGKSEIAQEIGTYLSQVHLQISYNRTYQALQSYGEKINKMALVYLAGQLLNMAPLIVVGPPGLAASMVGSAMALYAFVNSGEEDN